MSVNAVKHVFETSQHSGSALLLLIALAEYANKDEWQAWPSLETLAERTRLSKMQVTRLLKKLENSGEIEIDRGGGRGKSNLYRIVKGNTATLQNSEENSNTAMLQNDNKNSNIQDVNSNISSINSNIQDVNSNIAMLPEPLEPSIEPLRTTAVDADFGKFYGAWRSATTRADSSGSDGASLQLVYDDWRHVGIEELLQCVRIAAKSKGMGATANYLEGIIRKRANGNQNQSATGGALFEVYS